MTTLDQLFGAALIVPGVLAPRDAAAVRDRLAGFTRYALLDRGSYEVIDRVDEPVLFAMIEQHVARVAGRSLRVAESRVMRLAAGDYLLAHHDRIHDDNPVEAILDLSPAPVPDAEVHYRRRGQVFFQVPCMPGALSIVERGPTVTCNHCYVSKLHGTATVLRLVALLR